MPSHDESTFSSVDNIFHPDYLAHIADFDDPLTAAEAAHGGIWRVRPIDGGERYGLFRFWEDPESGDEPFGVLEDRSTAYLAAAFLPLAARARTLWARPSDDGHGQTLCRDGRDIGRLRYRDIELIEILNIAEALARSPESIAAFLAAAGYAALEPAGRILARESLSAS
jgi:hypothetical protein